MKKTKEKPTWTKRDWTPVRNGDAYCSPACGGGPVVCSVKRYQHAHEVANKVARDLGAIKYLAWLDEGNVGRHYEVLG